MNSQKLDKWRNLSSYLYDYIYDNGLEWPCMSCRWGPVIDRTEDYIKQKVYFSCRTDGVYTDSDNLWRKFAGFMVVAQINIPNPGIAFDEEMNNIFLQQNFKKCPHLTVKQILIHPGEINIMRKSYVDEKWICTHTDSTTVFVWNLEKHNHVPSKKENLTAETPDLRLVGHTDIAPYALGWAKNHSRIASGGKDQKVLIWDIEDYQTNMSSNLLLFNKRELNAINNTEKYTNLKINTKREFVGHTDTVEDLSFHPTNKEILISVGDDRKIICWDTRSDSMAYEITGLHNDDIHTIDWNKLDEDQIITGSNRGDGSGYSNLIDLRSRKPILVPKIPGKNNGIRCTQFSPFDKNIFASGAEQLHIYNSKLCLEQDHTNPIISHGPKKSGITDFDWNVASEWSIISSSDNSDQDVAGGGSLYAFRPSELTYLPEDEALQALEKQMYVVDEDEF